jgi:hypothetical protein
MKKLSIEDCKNIAKEKGGQCLSSFYVNNQTKMSWQCEFGHIWNTQLSVIRNMNVWCPHCSGNAKITIEGCQEIARKMGGECLSLIIKNTMTPLDFKCNHGHIWKSRYNDIQSGKWCPYCAGKARHTLEDCISIAKSKDGRCLSSEYINSKLKLTWECKNSHIWEANYSDINQGKWCRKCGRLSAKKTMLKKYGAEHHMHNKEIALKVAKSQNHSIMKNHWKTSEELICVGSYESKVIDYLNSNKIDFEWQPKIFQLTGTTYRPDLYLSDTDLWIEIKGYSRPDFIIKWNEFHQTICPNSEIWDTKKLKEIGVL